MEEILNRVKLFLAVDTDMFDEELLSYINATFAELVQIGVDILVDVELVTATTSWPYFGPYNTLAKLTKTYVDTEVRLLFDQTASATIQESRERYSTMLTSRLFVEGELIMATLEEITETPTWSDFWMQPQTIQPNKTVIVPDDHQTVVFGGITLEGDAELILEGSGQLIVPS